VYTLTIRDVGDCNGNGSDNGVGNGDGVREGEGCCRSCSSIGDVIECERRCDSIVSCLSERYYKLKVQEKGGVCER
jgi:hypothetical protein